MVAPKKKRSDLAVPDWVKERWSKGTNEKDEMADLLQHVNWSKESGLGLAGTKCKRLHVYVCIYIYMYTYICIFLMNILVLYIYI